MTAARCSPAGAWAKWAMPLPLPDSDLFQMTVALPDLDRTLALAARLAPLGQTGDCVALWGDLGAGKTELARGWLRAAGVEEDIPSPTFALVQPYETDLGPISHFDLYRLEGPEDTREIGFDAALDDGLVLVEWPGRLGEYLPADRLDIELTLDPQGRRAQLTGRGTWAARLATIAP